VLKFQRASFKGSGNIKGGIKHTKIDKNRVKNFSHNAKSQSKLSHLQPSKPENISPKQLPKLEYSRFEIFRPTGRNANAKFKRVPNFLGDEIQKSKSVRFCVLSPSRRLPNFRSISEEIKNLVSIFEIAVAPHRNAMRATPPHDE